MTEPPLYADDRLGSAKPLPRLTDAQRTEIEARYREHCEHRDRVYEQLLLDAQACGRAMQYSPRLDDPAEWEAAVSKSLEDYRSGRSLMDHLGAHRLLDPATTGMLLGIRRGLIAETDATAIGQFVLIDMVVMAFANAMRLQSIVGNTALILESELFCQPTLRAKWSKKYGSVPEEGLAVEEQLALLRDRLLPLAERFHRMGRESIGTLGRMRQAPAVTVERSEAVTIMLGTPGMGSAPG